MRESNICHELHTVSSQSQWIRQHSIRHLLLLSEIRASYLIGFARIRSRYSVPGSKISFIQGEPIWAVESCLSLKTDGRVSRGTYDERGVYCTKAMHVLWRVFQHAVPRTRVGD